MNRKFYIIYFLFVFIFFVSSCKTIELTRKPPVEKSTNYSIGDYFIENSSFKYLIGKASASYKSEKEESLLYLNFRWVCDSAFWMSVSPGLGIEAIRILLTNDSLFYFDRTKQEYLTESLQNLDKQLNLPLNLMFLQTFLSGRLSKPLDSTFFNYKMTDEGISLTNNLYNISNNILKDYYKFIGNFDILLNKKTPTIRKIKFWINDKNKYFIEVNYNEYVKADGEFLPKYCNMLIRGSNRSSFEMKFDKWQKVDKITLPFDIPSKYKPFQLSKIEIK